MKFTNKLNGAKNALKVSALSGLFFLGLMGLPVVGNCQVEVNDQDTNKIYEYGVDDIQPVGIRGTIEDMYKNLIASIVYPVKAREEGTEGVVRVEFVVEKDGSISNVRLTPGCKDIGNGCTEEAIRVVKTMSTKWVAATKDGKPVRSVWGLPIVFKLGPDSQVQGCSGNAE